jgi:VWFA-related protein
MRLSVSVLMAVVVAAVLVAQSPNPQQPTFRTAINFVRVDVYPTANGQPVADLGKADFEVLEDGVSQTVDTFEHIVVRPRDIAAERVEPRSLRESNQMAGDARNRLFVVFLDTYHVTETSVSHDGTFRMAGSTTGRVPQKPFPLGTARIDRALTNFLDRTIGRDDLFAVLTPELDVEQLSFTRRPDNFADLVSNVWGRRFSWDDLDPEEERWAICYIPDCPYHCYDGILLDMVRRRREARTLDVLRRLVIRLGELREERKAVLLVSEGWVRYRPDRQLARPLARVCSPGCPPEVPQGKGIYVGTDGKLKAGTDPRTYMTVDWQQCESARSTIAHTDNDVTYRQLMDEANRTNTSFYPVDPRGLAVFATPMDYKDLPQTPTNMTTLPVDKALLADATDMRERLETLRNLATATDGSMTETNDLKGGLKKIADDLSDYYLLGYYSTNAKADGTFRKITVRVKRPGVAVRARRGYLAATEAEVAARRAVAAALDPELATRESALASLGAIRSDRPLHMAAGLAWQASGAGAQPRPVVWVVGELDVSAVREMEWSAGGEASVTLMAPNGQPVATEQATVSPAARTFLLHLQRALAPGEYLVRTRVHGRSGSGVDASEQVRVTVPDARAKSASTLGQPLLFRRGPFTGPGFQPTADLRFRRAERLRVDIPLGGPAELISARLLDRKGQPLSIPVTTGQRDEGGLRFASAEIALAPLALGDYLIEVSARRGDREEKVLTAFRIVL